MSPVFLLYIRLSTRCSGNLIFAWKSAYCNLQFSRHCLNGKGKSGRMWRLLLPRRSSQDSRQTKAYEGRRPSGQLRCVDVTANTNNSSPRSPADVRRGNCRLDARSQATQPNEVRDRGRYFRIAQLFERLLTLED